VFNKCITFTLDGDRLAVVAFFCSKLFFSNDEGVALTKLVTLVGVDPLLTGVLGGSVLSMYSGDMYGPKDTRLLRE
jgi:hypothetical protein